ncbi:hypothetical protein LQV05_001828 [Cryptococcus neoformans]|nr:hypothetical protein LQV05_001828 [Cryptococcus neoformans]
MTGMLWCVFSHTRQTRDGTILSEKLYDVFRWLKWRPLGQNDGYEYIQEKTLDMQTFSEDILSPPFFLEINAVSIGRLHPVALVKVPVAPNLPSGPGFIVTIPIARHT